MKESLTEYVEGVRGIYPTNDKERSKRRLKSHMLRNWSNVVISFILSTQHNPLAISKSNINYIFRDRVHITPFPCTFGLRPTCTFEIGDRRLPL